MSTYSKGMLSDLFEGVVVKKLTLVETVTAKSNQHEFQGIRPLKSLFGEEDRPSLSGSARSRMRSARMAL